jgi:hypothetical protein
MADSMTSPDTGRAGEVRGRKLTEKQIQSAVIDRWRKLGLPHTRVAAIPNARAFGQPGLTKGVPDLLIIAPGLPIGLLELKTDKGKLSPEQEAFKSDCIIAGVEIAVTYGLDEAIKILEHWRVVRKV